MKCCIRMYGIAALFFTVIFLVICTMSPAFGADDGGFPDSGTTDMFSYRREAPDSDFFIIQPTANQASKPTAVSESFLKLVLKDSPVDDTTRLRIITQYPQIMDGIYTEQMTKNYPDASVDYDTPFQDYQDGNITIVQDPLAKPYVRISLELPSGEIQSFSLNRDIVEHILSDKNISDDALFSALQSFPYRLPEQARPGFEYLTASNIFAMAEESVEGVKRQEFVKTRQWYKQHKMVYATTTNAPAPRKVSVESAGDTGQPKTLSPAVLSTTATTNIEEIAKKKQPEHVNTSADNKYPEISFKIVLLLASILLAIVCILIIIRRKN